MCWLPASTIRSHCLKSPIVLHILPKGERRMLSILPKSLCHSFSRWSQRRTCTRRRHLESSIWCFLMERVTSRMQARFCGRSILTSHCWTWHQACYSLFFADVYTKVKSFMLLSAFAKRVRNIFGAVRHSPSAMFKKYSHQHNHGVHHGFHCYN